jgi:hypothetical protein
MKKALLILLPCFISSTAGADTVLRKSQNLADFDDFLSSPSVSIRQDASQMKYETLHYELRQGERIENGCRFSHTPGGEVGEKRLAKSIAQDMRTCTRLMLISRPR